jgi:aspartate/methionine/tyrosine aminotransferase
MLAALGPAGFHCLSPQGAYYIMADISAVNLAPDLLNDLAIVRHLIEKIGVAAVPGSSFFSNPGDGKTLIRFCFCKKYETLEEAERRLSRL